MDKTTLASAPRHVGVYAELALSVRGRPIRLTRVFDRSPIPMVMLDENRRFVHANTAARLGLGLSLVELRGRCVDDLTPTDFWPTMETAWARLIKSGCVAGVHPALLPGQERTEFTYFALAHALPGRHLVVFAPAGWPEDELCGDLGAPRDAPATMALTQRELEIVELAADGYSAPMVARKLVLSTATVRTHFGNVYAKLGVRDRAAAVAKALRLGLII